MATMTIEEALAHAKIHAVPIQRARCVMVFMFDNATQNNCKKFLAIV